MPPEDISDEKIGILGVKIWLLVDPGASWHKFAMALYSSSLNGALKQLKALKLLPKRGVFVNNYVELQLGL